jgi:hypothetical protein
MKPTLLTSLLFLVTVVISAPLRADIPPADVEPCQGKAAGDACVYGTAGTCQESTCSSPSPPPSGTTYACLRCVPGSTTGTQTSTASPTATGTATHTGTGTDTSSSGDSSWCSVGKTSMMGRIAPWLMAAAFSLLFLISRRRRQK